MIKILNENYYFDLDDGMRLRNLGSLMQWHKRDGIHGKLICARDFIIINFTIGVS